MNNASAMWSDDRLFFKNLPIIPVSLLDLLAAGIKATLTGEGYNGSEIEVYAKDAAREFYADFQCNIEDRDNMRDILSTLSQDCASFEMEWNAKKAVQLSDLSLYIMRSIGDDPKWRQGKAAAELVSLSSKSQGEFDLERSC